jgi:hypothetical protein
VAGIASAAALLLLAVGLLRRVLAPGRVTGSGSRARPRSTCWWRCASLQPYEALEAAMPGAFVSPTGAPQTLRSFSLVAQTSTGFGNVMPAAPFARTLAMLQAVTGQIFVAVLMARLVSLELAGRVGRGA